MAKANYRTPTRPRPRLSRFAQKLLSEWRALSLPDTTAVVVGVSGGADSCALLLALHELNSNGKLDLKLTVAHLDHGLRTESRKDADWVHDFAKALDCHFVTARAKLAIAKRGSENLEQAARNARYEFLLETATKAGSTIVTSAHTLDDQAETILMRLLRGSAAEGLSGTPAVRFLKPGSPVKLVRPLLSWARRADTEDFCRAHQVNFLRDAMNDDEAFSRVRVRKQLLPLMQSFNNRVVETLARTANLLGEDAAALRIEADHLLTSAAENSGKNRETKSSRLNVNVLAQAPPAVRRRALREWILRERGDLKRLELVHLMSVEGLLKGEKGGRVIELPGGMTVRRTRGMLEISGKKRLKKAASTSKIQRGSHRR